MRVHPRLLVATLVTVLVGVTTGARAQTADEILATYNLIVFGNVSSSSTVEGRTLINGTLTGQSSVYFTMGNQLAANPANALTVGGDITGNIKSVENGGNLAVGGNLLSGVNMNGGGSIFANNGATVVAQNVPLENIIRGPVTVPDFQSTLTQFSQLQTLRVANGTVTVANNRATFSAAPGTGLTVIDIPDGAAFFNSINELQFTLGNTAGFVINVGGAGPITLADNYLGGVSTVDDRVLWNFHEATAITVTNAVGGSVIAPLAALTMTSSIDGTVVAASLTQNAQVHLGGLSGFLGAELAAAPIPEPATWAMMILGFGLVAHRLRQRSEVARA